jgi:hypothetical protein
LRANIERGAIARADARAERTPCDRFALGTGKHARAAASTQLACVFGSAP